MRKPTVDDMIRYQDRALAVLRTLATTDRRMSMSDLAKAIGYLDEGEQFHQGHIKIVSRVLNVLRLCEKVIGQKAIEFGRIGATEPGPGFYTDVSIAKPRPRKPRAS